MHKIRDGYYILKRILPEVIDFSFSVDTPNMKTIAVPVLSAIVGLLGVLTLSHCCSCHCWCVRL